MRRTGGRIYLSVCSMQKYQGFLKHVIFLMTYLAHCFKDRGVRLIPHHYTKHLFWPQNNRGSPYLQNRYLAGTFSENCYQLPLPLWITLGLRSCWVTWVQQWLAQLGNSEPCKALSVFNRVSGSAWFLTEPFFSYNWSSARVWLLGLIITEYDRREKSSCSQLLLSGKFETLFEAML